jgi:serine/threonine protein kinase
MPVGAGERLGPYEIHRPIGAGGMGEVYQARDTRLGRDVAIKVSAGEFSARFEREARAIAALNQSASGSGAELASGSATVARDQRRC